MQAKINDGYVRAGPLAKELGFKKKPIKSLNDAIDEWQKSGIYLGENTYKVGNQHRLEATDADALKMIYNLSNLGKNGPVENKPKNKDLRPSPYVPLTTPEFDNTEDLEIGKIIIEENDVTFVEEYDDVFNDFSDKLAKDNEKYNRKIENIELGWIGRFLRFIRNCFGFK